MFSDLIIHRSSHDPVIAVQSFDIIISELRITIFELRILSHAVRSQLSRQGRLSKASTNRWAASSYSGHSDRTRGRFV